MLTIRVTSLRLAAAILLIAGAGAATAGDQAPPPERLADLKAEHKAVMEKFLKQVQADFDAARKAGKADSFKFPAGPDLRSLSARCLAIAERNPDGPDAFDALMETLRTSGGAGTGQPPLETRGKALAILRARWLTKPQIKDALRILANIGDESEAMVREVAANHPDRDVRVAAYRSLIRGRESKLRRATGAEAEHLRAELDGLHREADSKYPDLQPIAEIGKVAPDAAVADIDGKPARLSDRRGKVVVLDFWATWCGPCKAMIPHEREMVERLKGRPFELISISADTKRETLAAFLAKEKMPWTHWWIGAGSRIADDWDIVAFPTILVLDTDGVIRFKNIRGEKLEKAVVQLLDEAAKKKPAVN